MNVTELLQELDEVDAPPTQKREFLTHLLAWGLAILDENFKGTLSRKHIAALKKDLVAQTNIWCSERDLPRCDPSEVLHLKYHRWSENIPILDEFTMLSIRIKAIPRKLWWDRYERLHPTA